MIFSICSRRDQPYLYVMIVKRLNLMHLCIGTFTAFYKKNYVFSKILYYITSIFWQKGKFAGSSILVYIYCKKGQQKSTSFWLIRFSSANDNTITCMSTTIFKAIYKNRLWTLTERWARIQLNSHEWPQLHSTTHVFSHVEANHTKQVEGRSERMGTPSKNRSLARPLEATR